MPTLRFTKQGLWSNFTADPGLQVDPGLKGIPKDVMVAFALEPCHKSRNPTELRFLTT